MTKSKLQMKSLNSLFILSILVILVLNIISSQNISGLYFRLVNGQRKAAVEYLKNIKDLPQFQEDLGRQKAFFGQNIESAVFQEETYRKQRVKELEAVLKRNPQARDVLYALYILYNAEGNKQIADEYLRKAQEVDPNL